MKSNQLKLAFIGLASIALASACTSPRQVYVPEGQSQVSNAIICDSQFVTPTRADDCDQVRGYYYDPLTSALIYRAVLGGTTTIIQPDYSMPRSYRGQVGESVRLRRPVVYTPSRPTPVPSGGENVSPRPSGGTTTLPRPTTTPPATAPRPAATPSPAPKPTVAPPVRSNSNFSAPPKSGGTRGTSFSTPRSSGSRPSSSGRRR